MIVYKATFIFEASEIGVVKYIPVRAYSANEAVAIMKRMGYKNFKLI